jgi:spermidine synthase
MGNKAWRERLKTAIAALGRVLDTIAGTARRLLEYIRPAGAAMSAFYRRIGESAWKQAFLRRIERVNGLLSPKFLTLPRPAYAVTSMLAASAFIMAIETVLFHLLLIVTDYLTATSIIGMAMLGIALGGFTSFLLGKIPRLVSTTAASALLFLSVILAYYNVIASAFFSFPYLLILPFFFASFIVSNLFASGGSAGVLNFANLIGSGAGVCIPLFLVPMLKSETTLMVFLFLPPLLVFLAGLGTRNLALKAACLAAAVLAAWGVWKRIDGNLDLPDEIAPAVFEGKIMAELAWEWTDPEKQKLVNVQWEFMNRVYERDGDSYVFSSDDYDRTRARRLLEILGFGGGFGVPGLEKLPGSAPLPDPGRIPAARFDGEIARAFGQRFRLAMSRNWDREFLQRVYILRDDSYRLDGSSYDKQRAKLLLAELGHLPLIDLNIDVRRHGLLRDRGKSFNNNLRVQLSEDDLLGRVEYTGADNKPLMALNGVYLDGMDSYNGAYWDPRLPRVDFLKAPSIFIVGLSADGIAKSARRMEKGTVVGVELNPTIFRTMSEKGQFATAANRPYDGVEIHRAEGRSFLENDPRTWDLISLMNIHAEHGPLNTIGPENFHTVEGTRLMLDRLTDRGMIVYEEIITNARGELAFLKSLNTITTALRESGAAQPAKHLYVYRWDFYAGSSTFRTMCVKKTPFTPSETGQLDFYLAKLKETYPDTELSYSPYAATGTAYERQILGPERLSLERLPTVLSPSQLVHGFLGKLGDPRDVEFLLSKYSYSAGTYFLKTQELGPLERARLLQLCDQADVPYLADLSPTTDDRPFPFAVYMDKTEITSVISRVLLMSLLLFVPLLALLFRGVGAPVRLIVPALLYTAAAGFGYMLVEITLMQRFQLFIGDPTYTLVVVLGGLLVFSGLGSLASHFLPRKVSAVLCLAIPVMLFLYRSSLGDWFSAFAGLPFHGKLWASAGILFPLTFLMGMPFPIVMDTVTGKSSKEFASMLFGVSGGFATIASAVALYVNVEWGFSRGFTLGAAVYAVGIAFFLLLLFVFGRRVHE